MTSTTVEPAIVDDGARWCATWSGASGTVTAEVESHRNRPYLVLIVRPHIGDGVRMTCAPKPLQDWTRDDATGRGLWLGALLVADL